MKFLSLIFTHVKSKKTKNRGTKDHKQELFLKEGTEQFKALIRKGLAIPVTLL